MKVNTFIKLIGNTNIKPNLTEIEFFFNKIELKSIEEI